MSKHKISWIDQGREPKEAPNPDFPLGIDIPTPTPERESCFVELPYPAKRCGLYIVQCSECGFSAAITTAGRPDDPRSVRLPCARKLQ